MKTNITPKIIAWIVLPIFLFWATSTYAMWNWNWYKWNNLLNSNVIQAEITEEDKLLLIYSYREEKLAKEIYSNFYELYNLETFNKISESEEKHQSKIEELLRKYNIEIPVWYWELEDEYQALIKEWTLSLKNAIEVWIKIEMLDIDDLENSINSTNNLEIKKVFENLQKGSYNHIKWFSNALKQNWYESEIEYEKYLTSEMKTNKKQVKNKFKSFLKNENFKNLNVEINKIENKNLIINY